MIEFKSKKAKSKTSITHSARRINALADITAANNYLEIGVCKGKTFFDVKIENKVAVDPNFLFNHEEHVNDRQCFYKVESDHYFQKIIEPHKKFDIIFLDGLHTFEQTFRDFCASLLHSHENTVWVIDDVVPSDVFSALDDQESAIYYREMHGKKDDKSWHGDVFKVVYAINDFFPNMDLRTINTQGNPQTVVIRRPRSDFSPVYNDLSAITSLNYFDFMKNHSAFRMDSEENVLRWAKAMLS